VPLDGAPWVCQAAARGEVTFAGEEIRQFGLSSLASRTSSTGGDDPDWAAFPDIVEDSIARLPLGTGSSLPSDPRQLIADTLRALTLLVQITPGEQSGFQVNCLLLWAGNVSETTLTTVDSLLQTFTWRLVLAWKVLGR
jgi:hypothetical protein